MLLNRFLKVSSAFILASALAACSTVDLEDPSTTTDPGTGSNTNTDITTVNANNSLTNPLDPNSPLYRNRSVYFDFDSYEVSAQYRDTVKMHGDYLSKNPSARVVLEGNTDVRGSSEYNLALGQRRSEAVRRMLMLYGVKDSQMEAVSFGKEKPVALGNDEESHAQNRRVDIRYTSK